MRRSAALAVLVCGISAIAAAAPARAQTGPVIAIPSRPGVPIVINGRDASYAVVEGDWGLARPSIGITVFGGWPVLPNPVYEPRTSYYPRFGRSPQRGRNEIEPPPDRGLPEPAERFSRSWSTFGDSGGDRYGDPRMQRFNPVDVPATIVDPETFSLDYPAEIVVPRRRLRRYGPPP